MPPRVAAVPKAAEVTRRFVEEHPSIQDCLSYGILNVTSLARKIKAETGLANQDAIETAIRRYQRQMRAGEPREAQVLSVIKQSRLEVRTRVAIVTLVSDWGVLSTLLEAARQMLADRRHLLQILQGPHALTILCEEDLLDVVLGSLGKRPALSIHRELSAITVRSPEEIVETPGVLSFLAGVIYRAGINSLELMSVHTDSTFVVRQEDVLHAFRVLSEVIHPLVGPESVSGATGGLPVNDSARARG